MPACVSSRCSAAASGPIQPDPGPRRRAKSDCVAQSIALLVFASAVTDTTLHLATPGPIAAGRSHAAQHITHTPRMQLQQLHTAQDHMPVVSCTRLLARACSHVLPAPAAATPVSLQRALCLCPAAALPLCSGLPQRSRPRLWGLSHLVGTWQCRLPSAACAASTSSSSGSSSSSRGNSSSGSSGRNNGSKASRSWQRSPADTSSPGRSPQAPRQQDSQQRPAGAPRQPPPARTRRGPPASAPQGKPPPAPADWWEVEESTPGSNSSNSSSSSSNAGKPLTTTSSSSSSRDGSSSRAPAATGSRRQAAAAAPAISPLAPPSPEGSSSSGVVDTPATAGATPSSTSSSSSSSGRPLPVALSEDQVASMRAFLDLLLDTNKVMNLTSVRDPQEAWERHVGDSLSLLPLLDTLAAGGAARSGSSSGGGAVRLLDVGTGPGLPGMILALARPQWQVVLMDSLRKRTLFLERAVEQLGITNVKVVWGRAETLGRKQQLRESFDLVVARAVAELPVLAELCLPFVTPGGTWVAAKGADIQEELQAARPAISICCGRLREVSPVDSWSPLGQRTAVVVDKVGPISNILPRRPGTPAATPLTPKDAYKYGRRNTAPRGR